MELNRPKLKRLAISKIPLLESLSEAEREQLLELLVLKEYNRGESIITSDQTGREILFIADGSVDVKRSSGEGKEVIISRLGEGSFIGEIALLTNASRSADVVAVEDCMVLVLAAQDFEALLDSAKAFARALLVDLARRVAAASTKISDLALLDVYSRVFRALRGLAGQDKNTEAKVVSPRPTHKDLAAMVGTSREMVTRALAKLEADEIIVIEGEQVRLIGTVLD